MSTTFLSLSALAASIVTASFFSSCADDIPEPVIPAASASATSVELDVLADSAANPLSRSAELSYAVFDSEGGIVLNSGEKDAPDPVKTPDGWHLSLPVQPNEKYSVVFIGADSPCDIKANLLSNRGNGDANGVHALLENLSDGSLWTASTEVLSTETCTRTVKLIYHPNVRNTGIMPSTRFAGTFAKGSIPADWLWRIDGELYCIGADYGDTSFDFELEKPAAESYRLNGTLVRTIEVFPSTAMVKDMSEMFLGCRKLERICLDDFDTRNVTTMRAMFANCGALESLDLSGLDTRKVTDMGHMFKGCTGVTNLNLSGLDASNVNDMEAMFCDCINLTDIDLSSFDARSVTSMSNMFNNCQSLRIIDLRDFHNSDVSNMSWMFASCHSLSEIDLSGLDTRKVTDMGHMFKGCSSLESLDISNFDITSLVDAQEMFLGCDKLAHIRCRRTFKDWAIANATHIGLPEQMVKEAENWEIVD